MKNSDVRTWIAADDAVKRYAKWRGGKKAVRDALASGLIDGEIRARAQVKERSREHSIKKAWASNAAVRAKKASLPPAEIPLSKKLWRSSERWFFDREEWRWAGNRFSVTYARKPRRRWLIRGVEFALEDVKRVLDLKSTVGEKSPGSPVDVDRWREFSRVIAEFHASGRFRALQGPKALEGPINEEMTVEFGSDNLEAQCLWLWRELVGPDGRWTIRA